MRRAAGILALEAALLCAAGCGQGAITFQIEAPMDKTLSPLSDGRADSIALSDELSGLALGPPVPASGMNARAAIGGIKVGTYNLRMTVAGGGALLGLGRSRGITIAPGQTQTVTLHLRKPLAFSGPVRTFDEAVRPPLTAIDTTLPPGGAPPDLSSVKVTDPVHASASTNDGRYLLLGARDQVYLINTLDLSTVGQIAAGGTVTQVVVSDDDHAAAILSDAQVDLIQDLQAFIAGGPAASALVKVKLPAGVAASFSPDGQTLAVISSDPGTDGTWLAVSAQAKASWDSCNAALPKSYLSLIPVASPPDKPDRTALPNGATDIDYLDARPIVALPCGSGVVFADGPPGMPGQTALPGHGVLSVAVGTSDRAAVVEGRIVNQQVMADPEQPRVQNALLPFGQVSLYNGQTKVVTNSFRLPEDTLDFEGSDMTRVQTRLAPARVDAYEVALSPDENHVVMSARLRYQTSGFRYVPEFQDPNFPDVTYYCDLNLVEDVYQLLEIEAASGTVAYQSVRGVSDQECSTQCFVCQNKANCQGLTNPQRSTCKVSNGFAPGGLSLLMGPR